MNKNAYQVSVMTYFLADPNKFKYDQTKLNNKFQECIKTIKQLCDQKANISIEQKHLKQCIGCQQFIPEVSLIQPCKCSYFYHRDCLYGIMKIQYMSFKNSQTRVYKQQENYIEQFQLTCGSCHENITKTFKTQYNQKQEQCSDTVCKQPIDDSDIKYECNCLNNKNTIHEECLINQYRICKQISDDVKCQQCKQQMKFQFNDICHESKLQYKCNCCEIKSNYNQGQINPLHSIKNILFCKCNFIYCFSCIKEYIDFNNIEQYCCINPNCKTSFGFLAHKFHNILHDKFFTFQCKSIDSILRYKS